VTDEVRAAGGVPVRRIGAEDEVLVIHRARYGDWTFPKGKCEPGEGDEECALREVEEETGLRCELAEELPSTSYRDGHGRPKRVRYWRMDVVAGDPRPAPPEVDEVRWVGLEEALSLLTYPRDHVLVEALPGGIG
jgi:8-oxo-dGTP pyrophosphatase MutT (NUDIX family)